MKIKLILLILSFVTVLMFKVPVYAKGTYVALGDSITTGYGLSDSKESFPAIISEQMGYILKNHAKNGATSEDVLALLKSGAIDNDLKSASLITITCGGNDMMHTLYEEIITKYTQSSGMSIEISQIPQKLSEADSMTLMATLSVLTGDGITPFYDSQPFLNKLSAYEDNLQEILTLIKTLNPTARTIILTQYNPYKNATGVYAQIGGIFNEGIKKLNAVIHNTAEKNNWEICHVYEAFEKNTNNLCNADFENLNLDIHPNSNGHKVIAECLSGNQQDISNTVQPTHKSQKSISGSDLLIKSTLYSLYLILSV